MRIPALLAALASILAAAPAPAMQAGGVAPPPPAESAAPADWRAEMNVTVAEANHWRWRLRSVERRGDMLAIGLSYRNGANTGRPIYLELDYRDTTALIGEEDGARFDLVAVTGISDDVRAVDRRSSVFAEFTFRYPEGARSVTFTSRWVSMQMAGAAAVMAIDFPIALPPDGAGPI